MMTKIYLRNLHKLGDELQGDTIQVSNLQFCAHFGNWDIMVHYRNVTELYHLPLHFSAVCLWNRISLGELTFVQLFMKLQTIHGNCKHFCSAYSCPITLYLRRYAIVDIHALYCAALSDNSIALALYR